MEANLILCQFADRVGEVDWRKKPIYLTCSLAGGLKCRKR